ncbi:MAG: hypothetical protein ACOX56_04920 [Acholeplasmataceae bacterium]|jgi:hypothetical protein
MNKCIYCGSEDLRQIKVNSYGPVTVNLIKDDGKPKVFAKAPLYGDLCLKCGSISRFYIKEKHIQKFEK